MSRLLRLEFADALYHVTSRGDRREDIYHDGADGQAWLTVLAQVCKGFNWSVQAYLGYKARMDFDIDDKIIVGRVIDIDDILTFHGTSVAEFEAALKTAVDGYIQACKQLGQASEKPASGRLMLRVSPVVHAAAVKASARRRNADGRVVGQQADDEGRQAHDQNRDQEGVFATNHVAQTAKENSAERPHDEACRKRQRREVEGRAFVQPAEKLLGDHEGKSAIQVEVAPFENSAQRRREDHLLFFRCHWSRGRIFAD